MKKMKKTISRVSWGPFHKIDAVITLHTSGKFWLRITIGSIDDGEFHELTLFQLIFTVRLETMETNRCWEWQGRAAKLGNEKMHFQLVIPLWVAFWLHPLLVATWAGLDFRNPPQWWARGVRHSNVPNWACRGFGPPTSKQSMTELSHKSQHVGQLRKVTFDFFSLPYPIAAKRKNSQLKHLKKQVLTKFWQPLSG